MGRGKINIRWSPMCALMLYVCSQELQRQHFGVCVEKPQPSTPGSSFSPEVFQVSCITLCYVLFTRQPNQRESWDFWSSSISGYLSPIKHIAQVLPTKKAENFILERVNRYVMDEALGNYLALSGTAHESDESAMPRTGHWALGIRTLSEVQETAMETRTKRLERLDLHVLKKEGCGGKTRRGTVIFQRPVGYHTGSTELVCPQGHCNSHWVKSQQKGWRNFVVRHLKRLQRDSLSTVVFKNSIDTHSWGWYKKIIILSQDRRLV